MTTYHRLFLAAATTVFICVGFTSSAYAFKSLGVCSGVTCRGNGGLPTFTSSDGNIQNPEIVLIFWQDGGSNGFQWTTGSNPGGPTMRQVVASTLSLINTPFSAAAAQYGNQGGVNGLIAPLWTLSPIASVYTGFAPNTTNTTTNYTNNDIQSIVNFQVANRLVPPPLNNSLDDMVYVVMVPSTTGSTNCGPNGGGGAPGCNNSGTTLNGLNYMWAYVSNQNYTATLSHEVVEAIVDGWEGVTINNCATSNGAINGIGDVCQCNANFENENTYNVQAYWSAIDQACVIPETWGPLLQNNGHGYGWTNPSGSAPIRQAYGGGGGVVETFANDLPYYYNGTSTSWIYAGQGATFAVGGNGIAILYLDGSEIDYFSIAQQQWFNVGTPPGGATSMTITFGGWLVATDTGGNPWYSQNGGWVEFGGPGDQFIAIGYNIYALAVDHSYVAEWLGSQFGHGAGNWSIIANNNPSQIIGSSAETSWGVTMRGQNLFYPFDTTVAGEQFLGALQFAVSGGYQATYVAMGRTNVYEQSSNRQSAWVNTNSGPVGRLISGKEVYATSCATRPCVNY